jgi:hypothetical protein
MIKEINVKNIDVIQNSRARTDLSDVSLLMKDIKQNGLLHPIGVYEEKSRYVLLFGSRRLSAFKKLGYDKILANIMDKPTAQELLLINTSENLHREDLKPHELGRICLILNKQGLNKKEIATRLGLTGGDVRTFDGMFRQGKDFDGALREIKNCRTRQVAISVKQKETNTFLTAQKIGFQEYVLEVLKGQRKANPRILA